MGLLNSILPLQFCYSQQQSNPEILTAQNKELWFDSFVTSKKPELINGREYFVSFNGGSTNPFFESMQTHKCQLWYDGQYFPQVDLLYDIFVDQVVLRTLDKNGLSAMVELDQGKIEKYILGDHLFRKIITPGEALQKGSNYFEVLFEGKKISLVAKRKKITYNNQENLKLEYREEDELFLIYKKRLIPAKGTKAIFSLMGNNLSNLKNFMKLQKIPFKKVNETSLSRILSYCDTILQ